MNKKKIISQLATVTLLTSTLIATVGQINPDLVSVRGWATPGNFSTPKEIEGGVDVSGTLNQGSEQTHYGHRDNISFDVKVNKKVKAWDAITLKVTNIDGLFSAFKTDVKNKDGVIVGFITDDYYYNNNDGTTKERQYMDFGTSEQNRLYSTLFKSENIHTVDGESTRDYEGSSEDINNGIYKELKIIFNKEAENYDSLDLHFEANNVYSQTILTNFDRTVNYKMEYGSKVIFENSYFVKGAKKETDNRKVVTPRIDRSISELPIVNGRIWDTFINFSVDVNGEHGLKKGDKLTLKTKPDSNFKFEKIDPNFFSVGGKYDKNGTILEGNDFGIDKNGLYFGISRSTPKQVPSFKLLKSTPDEIVLELLDDNYTGSFLMTFNT